VRVAVATSIRWAAGSSSEAVRLLKKQVPGLPVEEDAEDLLFRKNQPTNLGRGTLVVRLNRLTTWQVQRFAAFEVGPDQLRERAHRYAVDLETDVNTDQQRSDPFTLDDLVWILDQIAGFTQSVLPGGQE
jgi:hypothetical protein